MKQLMCVTSDTFVEITKEKVEDILLTKISARGREERDDAFFVGDLGDIVRKHKLWQEQLPRVDPFYAVKCNDDPAVLQQLAYLGTGFDCASKAEIQTILDMGIAQERIIYANPCKQASHIRHAAKNNVAMMTFDNEMELHKVKSLYPEAKLVIRILPPDGTKAQCQLGMKFGCSAKEARDLLQTARDLDLSVIGVSFHVGSGCYDATAFSAAVALARTVFDMGAQQGYKFSLLDIGGGFPGQVSAPITFQEICAELRPALDSYFPADMGVRIISEPGRFFVASAFTLAVNIIAKRCTARDGIAEEMDAPSANDEPHYMYYVNDGVYGSFNCLMYDHAEVTPSLLEESSSDHVYSSSVWGPTCDGLDCIQKECLLPELETGDWMCFKDMGAYTMCAASNFNGMPKPICYYIVNDPTCLPISMRGVKREYMIEDSSASCPCAFSARGEVAPPLVQPDPFEIQTCVAEI